MSVQGKWRIVELPDYEDGFADLLELDCVLLGQTGGEFAFGCVTGAIAGGDDHDAVASGPDGDDEMDDASGQEWAEAQPDGSLSSEVQFHNGDDFAFIARRCPAHSTPC